LYFDNFFFNVANLENGRNWSTPWVVDNAEFYVVPPQGRSLNDLLRRGQTARTANRGPATADARGWLRR
jgi:hypothetical protein